MTDPHRATPTGKPFAEPWAAHATHWSRIGPPLRPWTEDCQRVQQAWLASLPSALPDRPIEILALGVTPEYALFPWAPQMRLHAVDASPDMIRAVWPGDTPHRRALLGDWRHLPFPDASFDLIVSDVGLSLLIEDSALAALARELHRVLRPEGRIAMRHWTRTRPETAASLAAAVAAGQFQNFHEFKMRLLLALDGEAQGCGLLLGHVWETFQRLFPDRAALADHLACDLQTIATIDVYREKNARYIFRPLDEIARVFHAFQLTEGPPGHYPSAEFCPVFTLTPHL